MMSSSSFGAISLLHPDRGGSGPGSGRAPEKGVFVGVGRSAVTRRSTGHFVVVVVVRGRSGGRCRGAPGGSEVPPLHSDFTVQLLVAALAPATLVLEHLPSQAAHHRADDHSRNGSDGTRGAADDRPDELSRNRAGFFGVVGPGGLGLVILLAAHDRTSQRAGHALVIPVDQPNWRSQNSAPEGHTTCSFARRSGQKRDSNAPKTRPNVRDRKKSRAGANDAR